jgi:hypothetical protein
MNESLELLNFIYQNARLNVITITNLNNCVQTINLKETMQESLKTYKLVCDEAIKEFIKLGHQTIDLDTMIKVNTYLKVFPDNRDGNLTQLLYESANKGIIAIREKLKQYSHSDSHIVNLAIKLLKAEQKNLRMLKKYL